MPLPPETVERLGCLRETLANVKIEVEDYQRLRILAGYPETIGQTHILLAMEKLGAAYESLNDGKLMHAPLELLFWLNDLLKDGPFDGTNLRDIRAGFFGSRRNSP